MKNREAVIIRTSVVGIIANVLLAAFKAVIGALTHSVAITLDAVNNLSDALSSVITIVGTKLAGRTPDKKHPLGYGRIEYLSATIIAVIVLYAGISSLVESIKKIIHPETADYSPIALIIIAVAVIVKIMLGLYVRRAGKKTDSDSLLASGSDALFDSIISAATLLAAAIYLIGGLSLEAWLGAVIAAVIIKSGLEMVRDALSKILGERVDHDTSVAVKQTISEFSEVGGAYDLVIHNYGPDMIVGSVHIEVPDTITAQELDTLQRQIAQKVYQKHHILLTGISVYSKNTHDSRAKNMEKDLKEIVSSMDGAIGMHGFYVNQEFQEIRFDVVIDFDVKDKRGLVEQIRRKVSEKYPDYQVIIQMDYDVSD